MIEYNRFSFWNTLLAIRGTALPQAIGRILGVILFAVFVQSCFEAAGVGFGWFDVKKFTGIDPTGHAVLGSLIGFLIVFRMNASNNRYWEGRSHWGQIINCSRNIVRFGAELTDGGGDLANLVTGYTICLRRSLQGMRDMEGADIFLTPEVCREAERFGNPPTAVAAAISGWISLYRQRGQLDTMDVRQLEDQLAKMVDAQGGCEKIQKTPLPFAYVVMIKQLIFVYLITLPFVLCTRCGWWSPLLVGVISLGLLGMEEASVETEDPFGTRENCLDMEAYTLTIARDVGQIAARKERLLAASASEA